MTRKLNNFTINNNKIFDGDNQEISINEYNNLLKIADNATHPLLILVYDL
jgi:hypothetical protein